MSSVAYLYFIPMDKYTKCVEEDKFSFGKMSTSFFDGSGNIQTNSLSSEKVYYIKSSQDCREGLSRDIQTYAQIANGVINKMSTFSRTSHKRFLRVNSKDYIRLSEDNKKILFDNLVLLLQTHNNYIFIRDLGTCVCIDFNGTASVAMVSLLTFIMRDCIKYLSENKDVTLDALTQYILSGKIYGEGMNLNTMDNFSKYYCLFNAFGLWLFSKYRHLYYSGSYSESVNGVCSYVQYKIKTTKEVSKRLLQFIKENNVNSSLLTISATQSGGSKIGLVKEIELLQDFYNARDGGSYG